MPPRRQRRPVRAPGPVDPPIAEAERRGYLEIHDNRITYHCARDYSADWNDPEEKVRARTYAWLIIDKGHRR